MMPEDIRFPTCPTPAPLWLFPLPGTGRVPAMLVLRLRMGSLTLLSVLWISWNWNGDDFAARCPFDYGFWCVFNTHCFGSFFFVGRFRVGRCAVGY